MINLLFRAFKHLFSAAMLRLGGVFVLAATLLAPFEAQFSLTLPQRAVFWSVVVVSTGVLAAVSRAMVGRLAAKVPAPTRDALMVLVMTLVLSPVVFGEALLFGKLFSTPAPGVLQVVLLVFLSATLVQLIRRGSLSDGERFLLQENGALGWPRDPAPAPLVELPGDRLLRRLPNPVSGPVLHLGARDHFVDITLPHGVETLRMRFADAIEDLEGLEGFLTHRSHWVARNAIVGTKREGGRLFLRLSDRSLVPVSRTYRPELERAGLL